MLLVLGDVRAGYMSGGGGLWFLGDVRAAGVHEWWRRTLVLGDAKAGCMSGGGGATTPTACDNDGNKATTTTTTTTHTYDDGNKATTIVTQQQPSQQ